MCSRQPLLEIQMNTPLRPQSHINAHADTQSNALRINKVLRNTYALLGSMFLFSAGVAYIAQAQGWHMPFWLMIGGIFGFSYAINKARNSVWGLVIAFAFAAFLGIITGGNIAFMLARYSNGGTLIAASFLLTSVAFFSLSGYALTTKRDFSGWISALAVGTTVIIGAFILNYFLKIPALGLAVSSVAIFLSCGWIIWQTQQAARGGMDNYIVIATGLLADIFVLFNNLMALLGFFGGDD